MDFYFEILKTAERVITKYIYMSLCKVDRSYQQRVNVWLICTEKPYWINVIMTQKMRYDHKYNL